MFKLHYLQSANKYPVFGMGYDPQADALRLVLLAALLLVAVVYFTVYIVVIVNAIT